MAYRGWGGWTQEKQTPVAIGGCRSQRDQKLFAIILIAFMAVKPVKCGLNAQPIPAQIQKQCVSHRQRYKQYERERSVEDRSRYADAEEQG